MTQYFADDRELTNHLVSCVERGVSWLRHRDAGGRLDWALLHGATSEELQEVRAGWQSHIRHLEREHYIEVVEEPCGFYRLAGASIPPSEAADPDAGSNLDGSEDPDSEVNDADAVSEGCTHPAREGFGARPRHTARALIALHQAGELANPMHKATVGMLIRQVSECNHWHNSAHYRSHAAAEVIAAANIRSAAQYQAFCRQNLRHEHMVPNIVLYRLITQHPNPTQEWLLDLFARYSLRATITREQDRLLRAHDMPPEFSVTGHPWFEHPLARYKEARLDGDLVPRAGRGWFVA